MVDAPDGNRHTFSQIGVGLSMAGLLATSACIGAERTLAPPASDAANGVEVDPRDTQVSDLTVAPETDQVSDEGDSGGDGCTSPVACPQAAPGSCQIAICLDGACAMKVADDDAPCNDGDPCRGDDVCKAGTCTAGSTLAPDQTSCSDGDACNGPELCNGAGQCVLWATPICTTTGPDLVCVDRQCVPSGMVPVADGTFQMGCDPDDTPVACGDGTTPRINVFLSAFAIDRTEVPESAFTACVAAAQCAPRAAFAASPTDPERPATPLTFGQAKDVCAFLGRRLCRETEWEKAARGGGVDARLYPWGDAAPTCSHANFAVASDAEAGAQSCSDDVDEGTVAVTSGAEGASPFGALNMLGNVREWVADGYDQDIYQTWRDAAEALHEADGAAPRWIENPPVPPEGPGGRVVRGLGWRDAASALRLDFRGSEMPTTAADDLGVRCCVDLAPVSPMSRR